MNKTRFVFLLVIFFALAIVGTSQAYNLLIANQTTHARLATAEAQLTRNAFAAVTPSLVALTPTPSSTAISSATAITDASATVSPTRRLSTPTQIAPTATPNKGTRIAPAPLGQSVLWTGRDGAQLRLTLLEFYRGESAWARIKAANPYNQPPPTTWEQMLFFVRAEFIKAGKDRAIMLSDDQFVLVTSNGETYRTFEGPSIVPPSPMFLKKTFVGETLEGWIAFSVRAGDARPLLAYGQTIFSDEMRVWLDTR